MKKFMVYKLAGIFIITALALGAAARNPTEASEMNGTSTEDLRITDPDFFEIADYFTEQEVDGRNKILTPRQKELIKITSLATQQSYELLKRETARALDMRLTPAEIKEAALQCAPYAGLPRAADALRAINETLAERGVKLPLESRAAVNKATRFEKGLDAQAALFGDGMRQIAKPGPGKIPPINYYLITNCFGDYYTRTGLDLETREMLTLVVLMNLGVEPQMMAHIRGNAGVGHGREFIAEMIYQCLPYMGYPRALNALACLEKVLPNAAE